MDANELPSPAPTLKPDITSLPSPAGKRVLDLGRVASQAITPEAAGPDAMAPLKALQRRWLLAATLAVLLAAPAALLAWFFIPAGKVTARSLTFVSAKTPRVIFNTQDSSAEYRVYQRSQIALVKSYKVFGSALKSPDVANLPMLKEQVDPLGWLGQEINVAFLQESEVLQIEMSGTQTRSEEMAKIVNAVTDAYLHEVVDEERVQRQQRMGKLQHIYEDYQQRLAAQRKTMQELATKVGSDDRSTLMYSQQLLMGQLSDERRRLSDVSHELRTTKARIAELMEMTGQDPGTAPNGAAGSVPTTTPQTPSPSNEIPQAPPTSRAVAAAKTTSPPNTLTPASKAAVANAATPSKAKAAPEPKASSPQVATAPPQPSSIEEVLEHQETIVKDRQQIRDIQAKIERESHKMRNPQFDPTIRHLQRQLAAAQKKLKDDKDYLRPMVGGNSPVEETAGRPISPLERLQREEHILTRIESELQKGIKSLRTQIADLNTGTIDLKSQEESYALQDHAAKSVGEELEGLRVEIEAPRRIWLIDKAIAPQRNNLLRQAEITAGASVGVLVLTLLAVAFWEYRARRIDNMDDVVQGLGFRLMGSLPALPDRARQGAAALTDERDRRWQFLLVESVDATRTMLLHASRAEGLQVVMVTSAVKGEGKTSLAGHLALSLGRGGRVTLLVDCDLRSPKTHRLFDVPLEPGLCEVLRGEAELTEAVQPTSANNVYVLPAGRCDAEALQILALDEVLHDVFNDLKQQYDFLVVDSAPILPVADSLSLSQHVDAVLFSILHEVSRVPDVRLAHERLRAIGARILGAVVTGTKTRPHYYSDYHYAMPAQNSNS
jgi:capsular exopolysaccharide synthesis family protein